MHYPSATGPHWCGERRRVRRAWPQCRWAAARPQYPQTTATPSPSKFRMQFPHDTNRCTLKNRRISTIRLQYLKYTQGNCMRNYRGTVRTRAIPRPGPAGVEGTGGPGEPSRSARGRWQGLVQTNFAHNFRRSFFETAQKRCNSNAVISMFEQVARELRAKLAGEQPLGHQAGHLASRAGRRPRRSPAPQPGPTAPGTPVGPRSKTTQQHTRTGGVPRGTPPVINTRSFNRG